MSGGKPVTHLSPPNWGEFVNNNERCTDNYWDAAFQSGVGNMSAGIAPWFHSAPTFLNGSMLFTTLYHPDERKWVQSGEEYEDILERVGAICLDTMMNNVAASLTKYGLKNSNQALHGTMSVSEVYVSVDWEWTTLPAVVILSSLALFTSTVFKNKKHGLTLWKSAILPVTYHGLESDLATVSQMERTAQVPVGLEFFYARNRLMFRR